MADYKFHPFAEAYPLMPAFELGRIEQAMRDRGFDPRFPVVIYDGMILDGRNRWLAAKAAGVEPILRRFDGTAEDARQFVVTANEERRHLTTEWLEQRRKERRERVAEARSEGKTLQEIAESEQVGVGTVYRDLQKSSSTFPHGKVDCESSADTKTQPTFNPLKVDDSKPATTVGKDGKERPQKYETKPVKPSSEPTAPPAAQTAPPQAILCRNCRTHTPKNDCPQCAELRKPLREPGDDTEHEEHAAASATMLDAEGESVPPQAVPAFLVAKDIVAICREIDAIVSRVQEIGRWPGGRLIRLDSFTQQLADAKGNLWANRATHVCPYCHGEKSDCKPCKGEGWTAKHVWASAPGNNKHSKRVES